MEIIHIFLVRGKFSYCKENLHAIPILGTNFQEL